MELEATRITFQGQNFSFCLPSPADHIQKTMRGSGEFYEVEMLQVIQQILPPDSLAIDVGANIGNHTVFIAGVCGARVVSVEPEDSCIELLRLNVDLNGLSSLVEIHHAAAGAEVARGKCVIEDPDNLGSSHVEKDMAGSVPIMPLDDIDLKGRIRLLKIDVEGMEIEVLEGAKQLLARDRPAIFVEAKDGPHLEQIKRVLQKLSYSVVEQFNWTPTWLFMPCKSSSERFLSLSAQFAGTASRLPGLVGRSFQEDLARLRSDLIVKLEYTKQQQEWLEDRIKMQHSQLLEELTKQFSTHDNASVRQAATTLVQEWEGFVCVQRLHREAFSQELEALKAIARVRSDEVLDRLSSLQSTSRETREGALTEMAGVRTTLRHQHEDMLTHLASLTKGYQAAIEGVATDLSDLRAKFQQQSEKLQEQIEVLECAQAAFQHRLDTGLQEIHRGYADSNSEFQRLQEQQQAQVVHNNLIDQRLREQQEAQVVHNSLIDQRLQELQGAQVAHNSLIAQRLQEAHLGLTSALRQHYDRFTHAHEMHQNGLNSIEGESRRELAKCLEVLNYIKQQNVWGEECTRREGQRLLDHLENVERRLTSIESRQRVTSDERIQKLRRENTQLQQSWDYCAGRAVMDLVRNPVVGVAKLPLRTIRGIRRIARKVLLGLASTAPRSKEPAQVTFPPKVIGPPMQTEAMASSTVDLKHATAAAASPERISTTQTTQLAQNGNALFKDLPAESGWSGWEVHAGATIGEGGLLTCMDTAGMPGLVRRGVPVTGGAYYRLTLCGEISAGSTELFWIVRDSSNAQDELNYFNENQVPIHYLRGHLSANSAEVVNFRTYLPTKELDLFLVMRKSKIGDVVRIKSITMEAITAEEASPRPLLADGERIIASMASIPGREHLLQDTVGSLLSQVDEVRVFLNGYERIPPFLQGNPRIIVEQSQLWGDNGDAGKFFWADDPSPGYRFICDDDISYPVDYVLKMVTSLRDYENHAIVGLHGITLVQPLKEYYDAHKRYVTAYRNKNGQDYTCHVLGTGAAAYHTNYVSVNSSAFEFPNMADIWLARIAQQQRIPMICLARPDNWVQPRLKDSEASIFAHSRARTATRMNTAEIQSSVVRWMNPVSIQKQRGHRQRKKLILAIKTFNRHEYLGDCIRSFCATCNTSYDWAVIVADDGSTDGTQQYLDELVIPHELHIIRNKRRYAVGQCNTIFELAQKIGFDIGFQVDDDIVFHRTGWDTLYVEAIEKSGYDHLCYLNMNHFVELRTRRDNSFQVPPVRRDSSAACETCIEVEQCMGALFTFTPRMLDAIGGGDEENFPIRGQWHIDLSIRACRAGFNDSRNFYDARGSNELLKLQNDIKGGEYRCSIPWDDDYKRTKDQAELARRQRVMSEPARVKVPLRSQSVPLRPDTVNGFFDRIYVLNLDRRPDRWERVSQQSDRLGISLHRFPAVDGRLAPFFEEYEAYAAQPLAQVPEHLRIQYTYDYYCKYPCEQSRIAFFEQRNQRKAIGSPGAWGYLMTMRGILEDALAHDLEHILVLDDDVLFHRQFNEEFSRTLKQVPTDWKILQLGSLQHNWDDKWIKWHSKNLYSCRGSSLGSHAVGMHRSIIPMVLNHCYRMNLPYDEGPLHNPKHLYPKQCLTFYPNLLIQDVAESDISTDTAQFAEIDVCNKVFRWDLQKYFS